MQKSLLFAKQFLMTSKQIAKPILDDWSTLDLKTGYQLRTHPSLSVTHIHNATTEITGLGVFFDAHSVGANDKTIIQRLADTCDGFTSLEKALAALGGRWVLIASINGQSRIYHDAGGQKSVFFHTSATNDKFICSSPSLLEHIDVVTKDKKLQEEFEAYPNSGSWPINILPYFDVQQLLPNHYLELENLAVNRYWPLYKLPELSVESASQKMASLLKSLTESATQRKSCILNLTGGYDSRLILASAESKWPECEFFTVHRTDSPTHDITIPNKLKKKFDLQHVFIQSDATNVESAKANEELNQQLQINVGGMRYDPSLQATLAVKNVVGEKTHLIGLISEVNRCYYYGNGQHPTEITPELLAQRAKFGNNPVAIKGCKLWLDSLPDDLPINLLDLFYWEHRVGVWASCGMTFAEAAFEQISPMNCREYLETGLSVDVKYRKSPYLLISHAIGQLNPSLLQFKFNYDFSDFIRRLKFRSMAIPRRIKRALG